MRQTRRLILATSHIIIFFMVKRATAIFNYKQQIQMEFSFCHLQAMKEKDI
jgi:hypothetical protein